MKEHILYSMRLAYKATEVLPKSFQQYASEKIQYNLEDRGEDFGEEDCYLEIDHSALPKRPEDRVNSSGLVEQVMFPDITNSRSDQIKTSRARDLHPGTPLCRRLHNYSANPASPWLRRSGMFSMLSLPTRSP